MGVIFLWLGDDVRFKRPQSTVSTARCLDIFTQGRLCLFCCTVLLFNVNQLLPDPASMFTPRATPSSGRRQPSRVTGRKSLSGTPTGLLFSPRRTSLAARWVDMNPVKNFENKAWIVTLNHIFMPLLTFKIWIIWYCLTQVNSYARKPRKRWVCPLWRPDLRVVAACQSDGGSDNGRR